MHTRFAPNYLITYEVINGCCILQILHNQRYTRISSPATPFAETSIFQLWQWLGAGSNQNKQFSFHS